VLAGLPALCSVLKTSLGAISVLEVRKSNPSSPVGRDVSTGGTEIAPDNPGARDRRDMVLWGEYHDRWVVVDGVWRIAERRVLEAGIEPRREGGVPNPRRARG